MEREHKRRIVYGVHGYGRGHAVRAQAIVPELARRYDVLVLAGDDAYDQLREHFPVVRIPTLRYHHNRKGHRSAMLTIQRSTPAFLDLLLGGPIVYMVADEIRRFGGEAVISDSDAWTHWAARLVGVPRISFDHYGIMARCKLPLPPLDAAVCAAESLVYRLLVIHPHRSIVTAFYDAQPRKANVRVVGPILREQVRQTQPSAGKHLLAYFSNASVNYTEAIDAALHKLDVPVKVYGPHEARREGNVEYCPTSTEAFLADLAACRAVFATAGNQLICEAMHFSKPLLFLPEQSLEQRLNADMVQRWGAGLRTGHGKVTAARLEEFLARNEEFAVNIRARRRDGLAEALAAIDEALSELCPAGDIAPVSSGEKPASAPTIQPSPARQAAQ